MSWKHQSPGHVMEDYWISMWYRQCSGTSQYSNTSGWAGACSDISADTAESFSF